MVYIEDAPIIIMMIGALLIGLIDPSVKRLIMERMGVIPAQAGIHAATTVDSRLRGNDKLGMY
jgi:hypothetical protein